MHEFKLTLKFLIADLNKTFPVTRILAFFQNHDSCSKYNINSLKNKLTGYFMFYLFIFFFYIQPYNLSPGKNKFDKIRVFRVDKVDII